MPTAPRRATVHNVSPSQPRVVRLLMDRPLTARRAARIIALCTVAVSVLGAVLAWLLDREDFPTLGGAIWWSLQTVTTVGYGDIVPARTEGRVIAGVVMLAGIGFLAVITAAVTASLIQGARRRWAEGSDEAMAAELQEIGTRLTAIESALEELRQVSRPED